MDFSAEQVKLIEQIAESVYYKLHASPRAKPEKNYHTVPEVRTIIQGKLHHLLIALGEDEISLDVLRHYIKKYIRMRDGDKELLGNVPRIDHQILNAICRRSWAASPFVPTGRLSHYRLVIK
jgi:predicted DNA-binding ArsR family transcriptional regulator